MGRKRRKGLITAGVLILSGIVLVGVVSYSGLRGLRAKPAGVPAAPPVAELVSATGMVLAQTPGKAEWREVKTGARFVEGDLVRTDSSGGAILRYENGATVSIFRGTVFTIRRLGGNQMEISASPEAAGLPPVLLAAEKTSVPFGARRGPFVELYQIIPFGKTLELIGRIEAGSRLIVNGDIVEVSGDGSFKHFTEPFPSSVDRVMLSLKVTDLAGRSSVWTATHDFSPHGRDN